MSNTCTLSKLPNFSKEYISLVKMLKNKQGVKEIRGEYLAELRKLKSKYSSDFSSEEFFDSISKIIDNSLDIYNYTEENLDLLQVLSVDYSKELNTYDPYFIESTIDDRSKFDKIDSTLLEKNNAKAIEESIIALYFPMASDARLSFELRFKYNLILKFFHNDSDPELPRINLSNKDMDQSVKSFRNNLFKHLDNYVEKYIPISWNGYKQRIPERKLEFFKNILGGTSFNISPIELIRISVVDTLQDEELKDKLNAYMAYIALVNFDDLVLSAFGDSIKILHKDNYKTDELKYKINLGNNNGLSWSDSKTDADSTEEIGGVIRLFMESLDMYDINGSKLPMKLTFSDVKSGLGAIMGLFSTQVDEISLGIQLLRNITLDQYLSINLKEDLENTLLNTLYKEDWDDIYDTYVKGKTLGSLIAATKNKPSLLMPLLFTLLATKANFIFKNRYLEKQAIYSFYENLFSLSNKNSLINRTINSNGINIDSADLYSFVASLFVNIENVPIIEYRKNEDQISLIGLRQNTSNSKLRSLKYTWEAQYNVSIPQLFKTFTIDDFGLGVITTVRLNNSNIFIKLTSTLTFSLGTNNVTPELINFLSEVLGIDINSNFFEKYFALGGNLKDLIDIAGRILYNYKVGKTLKTLIDNKKTNESEREIYDENIKRFYGQDVPKMMRGSMLPELISSSLFPKIRTLALALDIQNGYSKETTGKDGSKKLISLFGLSALDSKYHELMYNHNLGNPNSILTNFRIYKTLELVEYVRDYAGLENKKLAVEFSEEEFFYSNFLYDFYGGLIAISENGEFTDLRSDKANPTEPTKFRIMGPVISDKPKIPKLRFDWRSIVKLPNGKEKRYLDLTTDEIYSIQLQEFGDYYESVYNRIHKDLNNILPYVSRIINRLRTKLNLLAKPIIVPLDYDNDYLEFNAICKEFDLNPEDLIHEALTEYLKEARENGLNDTAIKIIKGIHYTGSTTFYNNPALFHQLSIYGRGKTFSVTKEHLPNMNIQTILESPEEARKRLNYQLISELLRNNVILRCGDPNSKDDSALTAALQFNPEVFDSNKNFNAKESWRKENVIIFAKLLINGEFNKNLFSLRDFKNWYEYLDLIEFLKANNSFLELYDISNLKFELQHTLKAIELLRKYNLFRYSEVLEALLEDYITKRKGLKLSIENIVRELYSKYTNWKPETIERKIQEKLSSLSKEDVIKEKAKYQLNKDIGNALMAELNGKSTTFYNKNLSFVQNLLETNSNISEDRKNEINSRISNPIVYDILLNPEIERYLALNNWLGEAFLLTSVGTFISHPGNNKASTIFNYEANMFGLQVKRNVSHSAEIHREALNTLKGIRSKVRVAVMTDAFDSYITFKGDYSKEGIEVHNGATFYNGTMVNLDNNSLGADAMGQDKKSFLHAIDPETGIAIIIKTAGFAVANSYILGSELFALLNKKMNHTIKWTDTLRKFGINNPYFNWLLDFNQKPLTINPIYIYRDGNWYKRSNFQINNETGETSYLEELVANNGNVINVKENGVKSAGIVNSNWELWNLFGGAYSGHINSEGRLSYINDETSFQMVNYIMNHTGIKTNKSNTILDLSQVLQVVKESLIDVISTTEAVKFGATNINEVEKILKDEDYILTYTEVFSDNFGEQLDAEHSAEGGHVSLMTLVMNALGARGYSTKEAEECYKALELLAELSFEEAFGLLSRLNSNKDSIEIREKFKIAVANIMLLSLKNVSLSDGNILSAIALGLRRFLNFGNFNEIEGSFPISSPQIFANLFSKLASTLEKASIRLKFDGGMLVLNPSNGIHQIINGKLAGRVSKEEVKKLLFESWNSSLLKSSQVKFGRRYFIIDGEGEYTSKLVDSLPDFYEVSNSIKKGLIVVEAFYDKLLVLKNPKTGLLFIANQDNFKSIGRDLATYDCAILESHSDRTFSLWEADAVKHLFSWDKKSKRFNLIDKGNTPKTLLEILWNKYHSGENLISESLFNDLKSAGIKEDLLSQLTNFNSIEEALLAELNKFGIKEINPELMLLYLEKSLQNVLSSISKSGIRKSIIINGESILIDNDKTTISPYEAIMPMIYKTTFGLKEDDDLGNIEKDKNFFIKRFIENSESKIDSSEFDLELKRVSGDHIYLAHPNREIYGTPIQIQTEVFEGSLYRLDPITLKRVYLIPSKVNEKTGQLEENCVIYKAENGIEIILTNDFLTFLNLDNYNSIYFGDLDYYSEYDENNIVINYNDNIIKDILTLLSQSDNQVALNKIKYVLNAITEKVQRTGAGLQADDPNYTLAINDAQLLTDFQFSWSDSLTYNSISEIFEDTEEGRIALNALHHHTLYSYDSSNLQRALEALKKVLDDPNLLELFISKYKYFKHLVDFGRKLHTSFLDSLEAVVSRTPALSHLSFMAMKIVGFDTNTTNSIFVSRMLLYLQGSDFDIDKANFLGLKFRNGVLDSWSPYYDLSTKEGADDSESLPFPSGKVLELLDDTENIPWDVIEKNYQKVEIENGYAFIDNNGNIIKARTLDEGQSYILEFIPNAEGKNTNTYLLQHSIIKNFQDSIIISNGVLDKNVFNFNSEGKYLGYNVLNDYSLYLNSLDLSKQDGKFNNLKDVGELIRTFTALNGIPSTFANEIQIVNKHNMFFLNSDGTKNKHKDKLKRRALYNFISIKTKNISKDSINLILGLSGIDEATKAVKDLVKPGGPFDRLSSIAESADNRSVFFRMRQLVLTLTGKENVGIVASAMKVFEAMSHHYYKVLANGTEEELKRLLSNITILGKTYSLIANSFTKNEDTILNDSVKEAYLKVNNLLDAFIMMSALLSLATDNAKDPTLSKLNATPQTLGCYTAGLVLGLSISEVANLLVSDTGLLLTKLLQNNVFNPKKNKFNRLSEVIKFLRTAPDIIEIFNDPLFDSLFVELGTRYDSAGKPILEPGIKILGRKNFFRLFGLEVDNDGDLVLKSGNTLWSLRGRKKFKLLAMYLLHPDKVELETDRTKIAKKNLENIKNDPGYYGWSEDKELEYKNSTGKKRERLLGEYNEYKELLALKESYESYLENPNSDKAKTALRDIDSQILLANLLSSDDIRKKFKNINFSNLGTKEIIESVFDWIDYRQVIDNDFIEINGIKYSRLENIRRLNSFNEEMGDLRSILKLNLGLPNSVQELLSWINTFKGILSRAANRQNRTVKEDSNNPLSIFSLKYGSLDLDLNLFLNDKEYQLDAIKAYESTKVGVNILDVMLNVPHYTGYLKIMNLLYEGGKAVSKNYATLAYLVKQVLPLLHLNTLELTEQFFKTLNPVIFEKINNMFIQLELAQFEIPKFKIENGELQEITGEDGKLEYEVITLGNRLANEHFKDYCIHYVLPYLKTNYPDNAFVKAIALRTYGYNLNHLVSTNIAKKDSYSMTNPFSKTKFNEVKRGLEELNGIPGLVKTLFYYNLLAYNNLPGALSLSDLFEDFIVYDTNDTIKNYTAFVTYIDESDIVLFDDNDLDYLLRVFAPKVFLGEKIDNIPYIWITNPENNKDVLLLAIGKMTDAEMEEMENLYENSGEEYNIDDNDFSEYSRFNSYKTLSDILKYLLLGQYKEADEIIQTKVNKRFLLGKNTLLNSDSLFTLITQEILLAKEDKKRGFAKVKSISTLSLELKNKILENNSENIILVINGNKLSLSEIVKMAETNGWLKQDVYNGFTFVLRKSKDSTYDALVISTLKTMLDLVTQQKDCNG